MASPKRPTTFGYQNEQGKGALIGQSTMGDIYSGPDQYLTQGGTSAYQPSQFQGGGINRQGYEGESDQDAWLRAAQAGGFDMSRLSLANDGTTNNLIGYRPGDPDYDAVKARFPTMVQPDGTVRVPSNVLQEGMPQLGLGKVGGIGILQDLALNAPLLFAAGGVAAGGLGAFSGLGAAEGGAALGAGGGLSGGAGGALAGEGALLGGASGAGVAGEGALLGGASGGGLAGGAGGGGLMTGAGGVALTEGGLGSLGSLFGSGGGSLINGIPNNVLSGVVQGVGGVLASNSQSDTLKSIYDQTRADRMPALNAYNAALANPNEWYNSAPAMGGVDAVLRKLSMGGNPANNPTALSQASAYNLGGYNDYLRGLSGPAFGTAATEGALGSNVAGAQGGMWEGLGSGIKTIMGGASPYDNYINTLTAGLKKQYGLT